MKKLISLFLIIAGLSLATTAQNLLSSRYSIEELSKALIPQARFTPFPKLNDRDGWSKADQETLKAYVKEAENYLTYTWPYIPATKSLLIERTGDREEYQNISFKKRQVLGTLLIAEIYENKGRFLDQIIDGVWSICEESFWGVPAHLPRTKEYSGLMDVSQPFVELFSAETATFLAWVDYYLGDKLDAVSPQIRKRIYNETNTRIFTPLMTKYHGWMGTNNDGRRPNNWNPWICSNWLNSVLLLEKDDQKRTQAVAKILTVLDAFLTPYPKDGGCDEGPGYWGAAAASLYDNISLLNVATNNAFAYVYADPKFREMGKFIYKAQISEKYFLNFADAAPQPGVDAEMVYRYGKDINDPDMMKFGAYYHRNEPGQLARFHFFRNFFSLFMQNEFAKAAKGLPLPADVWLPDLQVMAARDFQGTTKGFYAAAKGGNNDESHNHNDIGNFVVYYDGLPLLIDVGSGTYTRRTFSEKRYDIWFNCSNYHNLPTINGKNQLPGPKFKANSVNYQTSKSAIRFSLDISKAYPADAGILSWKRTLTFNRGKNVIIEDDARLERAESVTQHFMSCYPSEVSKPGELTIHHKTESGSIKDFKLEYNAGQFDASVEKVKLETAEDKGVIQKWGDSVYRINLTAKSPKASDTYVVKVMMK